MNLSLPSARAAPFKFQVCLRRGLRRSSFKLFCLLFVLFCLNTCRSHKKITTVDVGDGTFYTSCYPIESLYVPSCKLDISYGNPSVSLNSSIYIQSDSICYFRGKWLLVEMRGIIYRDSFLVVNYWDRICYKGTNDYLQRITGYPVNPESLLMLFTADQCEETWRNKFNFIISAGNSDKILMQGTNRSLLEMNINTGDRTIDNITLYNNQQRQPLFSATYSDYHHYPQFVLPTAFDISAHDGNTPIRIKANFQQILFDQPQTVDISIPSRYQVVVLE